jgi:hypothetical protein
LSPKRWVDYEPGKPRTFKIALVVRFDFTVAHKHRDAKRFALIVTGKPCQSKRCQVRFVVSVVEEIKRRTFDGRVGIEMAPGVVL